uniref:ATP synthase F0 subunit 8 n=1 Tax=Perionyx excavatus TaxID=168854 RepID=A6YFD1_9ANNE|nr:ATP synthase F0 subunit 8 [Perionyx excavatus]ABQ01582.1 ATP synthase F0 subunit 8 [Perionyx excavatus]
MPHLSPMSWLAAIISFWLILLIFASNGWWSNSHTFDADVTHHAKFSQKFWSWT